MRVKGFWLVILTFVIALVLSIITLPQWGALFRPAWVPVLLLFWILAFPHRIGLGIAWVLGIMLDVLNGTLIGEHALALVVITWLYLRFYRQIRMFPMMQQAVVVTILIAIYQVLLFWIQSLTGQEIESRFFWFPIGTTLLLWPLLCLFFKNKWN
jgi:rod shape-determining protein MreD